MANNVAVIGAGPCGLATARWILEEGMQATVFEQREGLGGLWLCEKTAGGHSPCYNSLMTNTPKRLTQYSDHPMPEEWPTFLHWSQVLSYLKGYATKHQLEEHLCFGAKVENIQRTESGRWQLTVNKAGTTTSEVFDAVAICTGHHWHPKMPEIAGLENFKGVVMHSNLYRQPDVVKSKRVLLVGIGVSGNEILAEIAPVVTKVDISSRRWMLESESLGPQVSKFDVHPPIKEIDASGVIIFQNGTKAEVDVIIACTGYSISLPFIAQNVVPLYKDQELLKLYKRCIVPDHPSLALIGFVTTFGSLHPIGEVQGRYFARTLAGKVSLPNREAMWEEIREWEKGTLDVTYRPMNVEFYDYINKMTAALNLPRKAVRKIEMKPAAPFVKLPLPTKEEKTYTPRCGTILLQPRTEKPEPTSESSVKVAAIQASSNLGTVEENVKKFDALTRQAASQGAKIVVFPEAAITGYTSQDLVESWHVPGRPLGKIPGTQSLFTGKPLDEFAETIPGKSTDHFCDLAKELQVYIVVPLVEQIPRPPSQNANASFFPPHPFIYYNSCVLCSPKGELVAHYRKNNLWGCVDNGWCTAGTEAVTYDTEYGRVGLAICFDVHVMYERYKPYRLWTLLYPIAWVDNDAESWYNIDLPERVQNAGFNVVGANWATDSPQKWVGAGFSRVIGNDGKILSAARDCVGDEIVYAELPVSKLDKPEQHEAEECACSDLLDPNSEPDWSRRSKSVTERFEVTFVYRFDDGLELQFSQGGDPNHLGMTVWDGGIVLSKYIEYQRVLGNLHLRGKRVVELGSGTGIVGIAAAALGAQVLLTDMDDGIQLQLLQQNVDSNAVAIAKRASVQGLHWGEPLSKEVSHFISSGVDYIIASDVIYSDDIVKPLISSLCALCTSPRTKILLAYETHKYTPIVEFFKQLKETNLEVKHVMPVDLHPEFQLGGVSVKLLSLRKDVVSSYE